MPSGYPHMDPTEGPPVCAGEGREWWRHCSRNTAENVHSFFPSLFLEADESAEPSGHSCSPAAHHRPEPQPWLDWQLCGFASHLKCLLMFKTCIVV